METKYICKIVYTSGAVVDIPVDAEMAMMLLS
jgi:hypothetical protein